MRSRARPTNRMWRIVPLATALLIATAALPAVGAVRAQAVTLVLHDYAFGSKTITLRAGTPVRLILDNEGTRDHEFQVYAAPKVSPADWNAYVMSHTYFKDMGEIDIALPGRAEIGTTTLFKVHLAPGTRAVVWFTPRARGRFEMASHDPGRAEESLRGTVVVE
ncbi:MAG TPA: hypothetical protein VJT33_13190 [bacterium]|nr:hypothetical protein [bacterium]